jgi:outer membrane protein
MKRQWYKQVALACAVLYSTTVLAQQKNEFSIAQCVDYASKNTAQVKNALLDVKAQEQFNKQITGLALPQVNASAGITHYFDIPVQSLPNFISPATYQVLVQEGVKNGSGNTITLPNGGDFGTIAARFGVPWTANAGVDVSQILFDGQVFVGLQAREEAMKLARKNVALTEEQIKVNIHKIYYQLVVGQKEMTSVDANIERFEKLLFDVKEIYKNGFAEKLDVDKVQVQLNNLYTAKIKIQNLLDAGNSGLKFLMSMPQKDILVLTDTLSEASLKAGILDSAYNYNDRKEIQVLTSAKTLNEYNVRRYQLSKIPSIVAFASYSKNAQRNKFDFFGRGDWFATSLAGLKIQVPLFDGFRKKTQIQTARIDVERTNNNIAAMQQLIDYEAEQSRIKMKSALLTLDNQKKNIELAEKVYNTTKKKFEQGLGNNQEIYNAQAELKIAQTDYYSALYDAITAKVDWLKAVGKL